MSYLAFVPHQTHTIQLITPALLNRTEDWENTELLGIFFVFYMRYSPVWGGVDLFGRVDRSFAFFGAAQMAMTPLVH